MNKKKSQSGNAHLILVIVLVIALIGAIGYIAWQNFLQPKSNNNIAMKTISLNPSAKRSITFNYPETWAVERSTTDGVDNIQATSGTDDIKIISPSKNLSVDLYYNVHGSGFGFECGPSDYDLLNQTTLVGYPGTSYFEAIGHDTHQDLSGYYYTAYLSGSLTPEELDNKKSQGPCDGDLRNVIKRVDAVDAQNRENENDIYSIWSALIMIKDGTLTEKLFPTTVEIDQLFASDEFKTAKTILLSAKIDE